MKVEVRKVNEVRKIAGKEYKYTWAVFVNGKQHGLFFKKKNAKEFAEKGAEVSYKAAKSAIKSLRKIGL